MKHRHSTGTIDPGVFETAMEISSEVIWVLEVRDGRTEYSWFGSAANKVKYRIPEENPNGEFWKQQLHSEDKDRVIHDFSAASSDPSVSHFEQKYRLLGNRDVYYYISDSMRFERSADGSIKRIIGVWNDITASEIRMSLMEELKQVNEQLSQNITEISEREFILNESQRLAKIASWEYDWETQTMFWSSELYSIYGVEKSFKVHDPMEMFRLFEFTSAPITPETFNDANLLPIDITARYITPQNYPKWIRITAYPVLENNELKRIIGLTYDITQSKEAEERLSRSEEKFAKAFQNNPDLMTIHRESDLWVIDVNKHVERVLGYAKEELIGRSAREFNFFVYTEDREAFSQDYRSNGTAFIETQWRRKDGSIIVVEITSTRVEINGENYSLNSIKDITSQKADKERSKKHLI